VVAAGAVVVVRRRQAVLRRLQAQRRLVERARVRVGVEVRLQPRRAAR
jgi:hypothetical protein